MAYGMGTGPKWPTIEAFKKEFEKLPENTKDSDCMVLTENGRLVTPSEYHKNYDRKAGSIGFVASNASLKSFVGQHLTGKAITERNVVRLSENIKKTNYRINFGDLKSALKTMETLPSTTRSPVSVTSSAGVLLQPSEHEKIAFFILDKLKGNKAEVVDLKSATLFLDSLINKYPEDVKTLRDVYCRNVADKFVRATTILDDLWIKHDFPDSASPPQPQPQPPHSSQSFSPRPSRNGYIDPASGIPIQPAAQKSMEDMRSNAKQLFGQSKFQTAFSQYQSIVENTNYNDNKECYKKCVMAMAGMLSEDGELSRMKEYPLYRLIPYLQHLIDDNNSDEVTRGFLNLMQAKLNTFVDPATGEHSPSLRPKPKVDFYHGSTITVGPLRTLHKAYQPAKFTEERYVDCRPACLSVSAKDAFTRWNKTVKHEKLEELEYRVVPDHDIVHQKILRENDKASSEGERMSRGEAFPPKGNMTPQSKIPGFKSEHSQNIPEVGVACAQGRRSNNEDAHIAKRFNINVAGKPITVSMTGVFDGHSVNYAGHLASRYVASHLEECLRARLEQYNHGELTEVGIWNAIKLALVDVDWAEYLFEGGIDHTGTTANVALVIGNKLWIANVGDSRAMLAFPNGSYIQLSQDAKPGYAGTYPNGDKVPNEHSQRVRKRGGDTNKTFASGAVKGNLRTTASIGDHNLGGVISARPKITSYFLKDIQKALLVQCCDGVYDVANCAQVSSFIRDDAHWQTPMDTKRAAESLVTASYDANSRDNLTAIVVPISALSQQ